jgi:methionyl aminopeptidase
MSQIPIKSAREIEKMRRAGQAASEILERVSSFLRPGLLTREVDRYAAETIAEFGCTSAFLNYRGFPGNVCISINEEVVHGIGGARCIQYGDIVKLDVGVFKDGWVGDTARTVPIGMVPAAVQQLLQVTAESLERAIPLVREGRRLHDVSGAIESYVVSHGYSVVREFVGHGVGRKLHEEPQVPNYRSGVIPKLRAGMTLAIEPMVNMGKAAVKVLGDKWTVVTVDRQPSAHFEHTVLVTKGDPEILTWREKAVSGL